MTQEITKIGQDSGTGEVCARVSSIGSSIGSSKVGEEGSPNITSSFQDLTMKVSVATQKKRSSVCTHAHSTIFAEIFLC